MQCFKNGYFIAFFRKISRAGKPGGTGADNGNTVSVRGSDFGSNVAVRVMPIGNKAFKSAYADGLAFDSANTFGFALGLLRTYSAADCGKRRGLVNYLIRALKISVFYLCDKFGNMNIYGTARNTGHIFATEAAKRFVNCRLCRITRGDFIEIVRANRGFLRRHRFFFQTHIRHNYLTSLRNRLHVSS